MNIDFALHKPIALGDLAGVLASLGRKRNRKEAAADDAIAID
jgi:hypothetical protein